MRQRGFGAVEIVATLAVLAAVGGMLWSYNHAIELKAKLEKEIEDCRGKNKQLNQIIFDKNEAVAKWQAAFEKQQKLAEEAKEKAEKAARADRQKAAQLHALRTTVRPKDVGSCPAGTAVDQVRNVLRQGLQ